MPYLRFQNLENSKLKIFFYVWYKLIYWQNLTWTNVGLCKHLADLVGLLVCSIAEILMCLIMGASLNWFGIVMPGSMKFKKILNSKTHLAPRVSNDGFYTKDHFQFH